MQPVEPSRCCTPCPECADYTAWLEGQVLAMADAYRALSGMLNAQANVAATTAELSGLYDQAGKLVQDRRVHQIERHLTEGDERAP